MTKKLARKNTAPKILAAENAAITQFLFDCTLPTPGTKMPLALVFGAYQAWRIKNKMPRTRLNIDGFGRLFPDFYPRKSAHWKPVGHALKCVFDMSLK